MKIVADSKPIVVRYKTDGKLYGNPGEEGGTQAPFDELRLEQGNEITLGDNDTLVGAATLES